MSLHTSSTLHPQSSTVMCMRIIFSLQFHTSISCFHTLCITVIPIFISQFVTCRNKFVSPQAGHVYICDLKIMEGLPTRSGQYSCAPICLLYVNSSKQLVPIAIQLRQGEAKVYSRTIYHQSPVQAYDHS